MRIEKWTHGMAYMAFGATAAYLVMGGLKGDALLLPWLLSLAGVIVGGGLWARVAWRRHVRMAGMPEIRRSARPAKSGGDKALLGHELNNYLCTLKGNAHLLRQRVPGTEQAIIDRIDRVVEKLETFTRGLSEAGDPATASGAFSMVRPAEAARACVRTHFHRRLEAFVCIEDTDAPALRGDPGRLDQVFLNLYANALEAGARRVETRVSSEAGRLVVRVEDDGRGCPREDLGRIFEPFYTTKGGPARRGLGMFIVQSIIENHGGRIGVAAKNGSPDGRTGLVFTLDFPAGKAHPQAGAGAAAAVFPRALAVPAPSA